MRQGVGLVLQVRRGMSHPCLHLKQQQRQGFINTFALLPSIPRADLINYQKSPVPFSSINQIKMSYFLHLTGNTGFV